MRRASLLLVAAACAGEVVEQPPAAPAREADAGVPTVCPPKGPFGTRVGQFVPNVILEDCEGQTRQLHELCGYEAAYFYVYAGW